MEHQIGARCGLGPAGIAHQIGGDQLQIRRTERAAHLVGAAEAADGAAHRPALRDKLLDGETGDIARRARNQYDTF